jgi:hypothetical protein
MCLGLCIKNKIVARNYEGLNGIKGHGGYLIENNKWVYSNNDEKYNYKRRGF